LRILIAGAHRWYQWFHEPLVRDDFGTVTEALHEHFRWLARRLLDAGRVVEAPLHSRPTKRAPTTS
jgi:hypothetical protein